MLTCAPSTSFSICSVTISAGGPATTAGGALVTAGAAARRVGRGCSTAGGAATGGGGAGTTTGAGTVAAGVRAGAGFGREVTYKPTPVTRRRTTKTAITICRFTRSIVTHLARRRTWRRRT